MVEVFVHLSGRCSTIKACALFRLKLAVLVDRVNRINECPGLRGMLEAPIDISVNTSVSGSGWI